MSSCFPVSLFFRSSCPDKSADRLRELSNKLIAAKLNYGEEQQDEFDRKLELLITYFTAKYFGRDIEDSHVEYECFEINKLFDNKVQQFFNISLVKSLMNVSQHRYYFLERNKEKLTNSALNLLTMVVGPVDWETTASKISYIKPCIFLDQVKPGVHEPFDLSKFYQPNNYVIPTVNKKEQNQFHSENISSYGYEYKGTIVAPLEETKWELKRKLLGSNDSRENEAMEPYKNKQCYDKFLPLSKEFCVGVGKHLVEGMLTKEEGKSKSTDLIKFEEKQDNSSASEESQYFSCNVELDYKLDVDNMSASAESQYFSCNVELDYKLDVDNMSASAENEGFLFDNKSESEISFQASVVEEKSLFEHAEYSTDEFNQGSVKAFVIENEDEILEPEVDRNEASESCSRHEESNGTIAGSLKEKSELAKEKIPSELTLENSSIESEKLILVYLQGNYPNKYERIKDWLGKLNESPHKFTSRQFDEVTRAFFNVIKPEEYPNAEKYGCFKLLYSFVFNQSTPELLNYYFSQDGMKINIWIMDCFIRHLNNTDIMVFTKHCDRIHDIIKYFFELYSGDDELYKYENIILVRKLQILSKIAMMCMNGEQYRIEKGQIVIINLPDSLGYDTSKLSFPLSKNDVDAILRVEVYYSPVEIDNIPLISQSFMLDFIETLNLEEDSLSQSTEFQLWCLVSMAQKDKEWFTQNIILFVGVCLLIMNEELTVTDVKLLEYLEELGKNAQKLIQENGVFQGDVSEVTLLQIQEACHKYNENLPPEGWFDIDSPISKIIKQISSMANDESLNTTDALRLFKDILEILEILETLNNRNNLYLIDEWVKIVEQGKINGEFICLTIRELNSIESATLLAGVLENNCFARFISEACVSLDIRPNLRMWACIINYSGYNTTWLLSHLDWLNNLPVPVLTEGRTFMLKRIQGFKFIASLLIRGEISLYRINQSNKNSPIQQISIKKSLAQDNKKGTVIYTPINQSNEDLICFLMYTRNMKSKITINYYLINFLLNSFMPHNAVEQDIICFVEGLNQVTNKNQNKFSKEQLNQIRSRIVQLENYWSKKSELTNSDVL